MNSLVASEVAVDDALQKEAEEIEENKMPKTKK
mgnify:CR=1 FL=1